MNCWEAEFGEVSESESAKLAMFIILGFPYGEPPLSRTRTLAPCESVAASGQPEVPPPMTM
jgi:hypothetical protein